MAGSRKDVNYAADDASEFAINVDESNIELVMGASVPLTNLPARKPSNMKTLRSVELVDITGNIKRIVPVLTVARFNSINGATPFTLAATDSAAGTPVRISRKIPERLTRVPKDFDSGLNDGDAT